ncbi:DMT family transporter [Halorarum halophilum]|uniref:DMT family transporter n=1 Tax=Halorarum halophilum TaxID=2743090 RepID=A0A7D5GJS6_9EURY|nr:EamA family transporter [Halobaculum halophilum]QLG29131.1 DMT family transporter [Halobaculum halophilum]
MIPIQVGEVLSPGVLLAVLGAALLAVQSLTVRYGTVTSRSADALLVVLAVNVVVLVPLTLVLERPLRTLTLRSFAAFAAAGLVGTMAARAFYYESIKRIGSSRAEPIKASQPLHATLVAVLVIGETVGPRHLLAMVCIVVGVALISYEHGRSNDGESEGGYAALALPLAAAFLFGIEPTFAKLGFAEGTSILSGLLVKTVSAALAFALYLAWKRGLPRPSDFRRTELPWMVGAGLANTSFLLVYYGALTLEPVSVVVPLVQASPLLVILLSMLFVSDDLERVTWRLAAGASVVVVGAIGVTLAS